MHTFTYGQDYPADFAQVLVANAIANPTAMAFASDGRIFVAEQGGRLRVIKNGTLLPTPSVQLTVSSTGERGLIGITLDPDFENNQHIYLYYTVPGPPPHNRVSRFTASGDVVLAGSEVIILDLDPLSNATNHNGGAMHFGKDGKLYVAVGENANSALAQNLDTYHGKILRINKDGSAPVDNPFPTGSEQRKRVWSYGLRNPFTFSIHPETGRILVNDVGQVSWEEVNDASEPGKNFGWPTTEGKFNAASYPALTNPIYAYPRGTGDGNGCAITGGVFYYPESTNYPSTYIDRYFIQDFCNRWINFLDVSTTAASRFSFATSIATSAVALSVGRDGNLYYLSRGAGALYKIIYNKTTIPYITEHPLSLTVAEGEPATFNVSALGSTPFEYQWEKDGTEILHATGPTYFINSSSVDEGDYRVVVSNDAGNTISNIATLSVIRNARPTASIISPPDSSLYAAGTEISFSGTGTDPEDGELPPNAFQWQVDFHHDGHKHDQPPIPSVMNGSFVVPDEGETSDNVWYTIILTVTDSKGSAAKDSVRILPRKSVISLTTDPPGFQILVDGQPFSTPFEIVSIEGMKRSFSVESPQVVDGTEFEFEGWSNNGEIVQTLTTPVQDTSLTARFTITVGTENLHTTEANVILFPNPVTENLCTVQFVVAEAQDVCIRLVNILAQQVFAVTESLAAGAHSVLINVGQATPGIYYVMINTNGRQIARRLIVARLN
jgi:glucose/arabinose dehydrogenase